MSECFETVVLDREGLSAWLAQDRKTVVLLRELQDSGGNFVISANTIIEVTHARVNSARLNWLLSQIKVIPVTDQSARAAARLLKDAGLHGHKYAIDATVAETALRQPGPVAVVTSDTDDLRRLCGTRLRLISI